MLLLRFVLALALWLSASPAAAVGLYWDVNLDEPGTQYSRVIGLGTVIEVNLWSIEDAGVSPVGVGGFSGQVVFNSSLIVLASSGVTWGGIAGGGAIDLNSGLPTAPSSSAMLSPTGPVSGFVDSTGGFAIAAADDFLIDAMPVVIATITFFATGTGTTEIDLADIGAHILSDHEGDSIPFTWSGPAMVSVVPEPAGLPLVALLAAAAWRYRARRHS